MIEAGLVAIVLLLMGAVSLVSAGPLVTLGMWLAVVGLVGGTLAGFLYHLRLRAALAARGALPRDWWLRPVRQHALLAPSQLPALQPWFSIGAAGFVVSVVGCVLAMGGVLKSVIPPG